MLIQPGVNTPSVLDQVTLIRESSRKVVDITFTDDSGSPTNIDETMDSSGNARGEVELALTSFANTAIYDETYWPVPIPDTRRITNPATGKYQIILGEEDYESETDSIGPILANWHIRQTSGSEDFYRTQVIEVVSPRTLAMLPRFRLLLDKSIKVVIPEEYCNLGYTDAQLVIYLQAGLSRINSAQPYPMWATLDQFPLESGSEILMRSALLFALDSQAIFASDTDIPAYSDQGHSFQINHFSQLKSLRDSIASELERDIRAYKLHHVSSGSVGLQYMIGLGFYAMITSSPPGSLFRRTYTAGPL